MFDEVYADLIDAGFEGSASVSGVNPKTGKRWTLKPTTMSVGERPTRSVGNSDSNGRGGIGCHPIFHAQGTGGSHCHDARGAAMPALLGQRKTSAGAWRPYSVRELPTGELRWYWDPDETPDGEQLDGVADITDTTGCMGVDVSQGEAELITGLVPPACWDKLREMM